MMPTMISATIAITPSTIAARCRSPVPTAGIGWVSGSRVLIESRGSGFIAISARDAGSPDGRRQ